MDPDCYFKDEAVEFVLQKARLVVFDLNGLILNDEPLQISAANAALVRYGMRFDEETWTKRFFGRRSSEYFSEIIQESGRKAMPELVKSLVADKDRFYRDLLARHLLSSVFPGAVALIRYLHTRGDRPLALATSASRAELQSAMGPPGLNLLGLFQFVICGEDVVEGKPGPETYMRVAALSGLPPELALVFEDSSIGVRAALGAGMPVVAVPNRFTAGEDFSGATIVISDLTPHAKVITPGGLHE